jgi:threonine dehydratase
MISAEGVREAYQRICDFIENTPLTYDKEISLYLKWENLQRTGSFKIRGALNKVLSLNTNEILNGLITCSAGNHGQGVAVAARMVGATCVVYASDHAVPVKLEAMERLGAEVRLVAGGYVEAERTAIAAARSTGATFISPYNDPMVIAGQGTIGLEISQAMGNLDQVRCLLVPVGGGGLLSGIGAYLQELPVRPRLIGVQSEASPFAYNLFKTGSQAGVIEADSIADGLAGEMDPESITIPLIMRYLDDVILVSEDEIRVAISYAWVRHRQMIEGSAAVGLAAKLAGKITLSPALTIVTGGNIQPELFNAITRRN